MLLANDSGNCMAGVLMVTSLLTLVAAAIVASLNCRALASPNILILISTLWFLSRW